ncbi:hypothetical protein ABU178_08450 [Pantoea osteomyelitidis]|uniref:Uncharacterized protein n=1 Tax=Pantoea osteomyelitidis TaxID=3230026 RepID=A0ABW7PV76_9GAMM
MSDLNLEKVQGWAARRLTEQQIADVLAINLEALKKDRENIRQFREAIRIGRAKGEAELRDALYKRAKNGDAYAYTKLMRREQEQDSS